MAVSFSINLVMNHRPTVVASPAGKRRHRFPRGHSSIRSNKVQSACWNWVTSDGFSHWHPCVGPRPIPLAPPNWSLFATFRSELVIIVPMIVLPEETWNLIRWLWPSIWPTDTVCVITSKEVLIVAKLVVKKTLLRCMFFLRINVIECWPFL